MDPELQAKRSSRISKSGNGINHNTDKEHPGKAYREKELRPASSSSAPRGRMSEMEGRGGVLSCESDGVGNGKERRCSEIGSEGRWIDGVDGAGQSSSGAWQASSERESAR